MHRARCRFQGWNLPLKIQRLSNEFSIQFQRNHSLLVGGWTNPSEKYEFVNWDDDIPNIWKNKKCSKPPSSLGFSTINYLAMESSQHLWTSPETGKPRGSCQCNCPTTDSDGQIAQRNSRKPSNEYTAVAGRCYLSQEGQVPRKTWKWWHIIDVVPESYVTWSMAFEYQG